MLQLTANGQQLDTSGVKFNLTLKNPMFTDGLEGDYVYSITLPWTKTNKKTFGFPNRLEKYSDNLGDFYFNGTHSGRGLFTSAIGTVKASKNKSFNVNVKVGTGSVFYKLKDKSLKDIDLGGDRFVGANYVDQIAYFNSLTSLEYPDSDFVLFPMLNEHFYNDTSKETYWLNNIKYVNYYKSGSFYAPADETGSTFIPFVYASYLIKKIFNTHGYNLIDNEFYSNQDLRNLIIYNNFADVVSTWLPTPGTHIPGTNTTRNLKNHVPDIPVLDFLESLKLFGIAIFSNNVTNEIQIKFLKDILQNPEYIEYSSNILSEHKIDFKENISALFSYKFENDDFSKDYFLTNLDDFTVNDPVATGGDLPADADSFVNEVRLVVDQDTYYIYSWNDSLSGYYWTLFCFHFQDFTVGDGKLEKYEFNISPLMINEILDLHYDAPSNRNWLVPIIFQKGSNSFFLSSRKPFINTPSHRFLFYRGLQLDSQAALYPLGSNSVYNFAGEKITNANLSLKWEGQYGLYEKLWKPFIDWYANIKREITFKKQMTPLEIYNFDFSKKYRINGIDYLIKEVKIPITETAILPATLKCYKV